MKSDNELYMQGCFMMFCRGEKWVRQTVPDQPKPAAPVEAASGAGALIEQDRAHRRVMHVDLSVRRQPAQQARASPPDAP